MKLLLAFALGLWLIPTSRADSCVPDLSISHSSVLTKGGELIFYTVTAGYQPIYAPGTQNGAIRACLFFFAYSRDDHANDTIWPITFLFNGGPGLPSDWIHLGGLGPKILNFGDRGINSHPNSELINNSETLLASSDLVFVDPIGSGYSRPMSGTDQSEFNGLHPDAESIGDFIQGFLRRFHRDESPKHLIGESYSGMRIPVLARYLDEKLGIKLNGIVLISPFLDAIGSEPWEDDVDSANDLPYLSYLPTMATTAWYHQKLSAELQAKSVVEVYQEVLEFTHSTFVGALSLGNDLSTGLLKSVARSLSAYTSFPTSIFENQRLRIDSSYFSENLLKEEHLLVNGCDSRMTGQCNASNPIFHEADQQYFEKTLGANVNQTFSYQMSPWDSWSGANPNGTMFGGYLNVLSELEILLKNNPELKLYIASGLYDLVTPAAQIRYMIRHLSPDAFKRVEMDLYEAGHSIYFGKESREKLLQKIAKSYF